MWGSGLHGLCYGSNRPPAMIVVVYEYGSRLEERQEAPLSLGLCDARIQRSEDGGKAKNGRR